MAKSDPGRPPEYRLRAFNKVTGKATNVGAGWANENGSVTIVLDPFVVLKQRAAFSFHLYKTDAPVRKPREKTDDGADGAGQTG